MIEITDADELLALAEDALTETKVRDRKPSTGACEKCAQNEMLREGGPKVEGAFFKNGAASDGTTFVFSVLAARELVKGEPKRIPPRLLSWFVWESWIEDAHLPHIASAADSPGIVAFLAYEGPFGSSIFRAIVDGSHRAAYCLNNGRDFFAHVLLPREAVSAVCLARGVQNQMFGYRNRNPDVAKLKRRIKDPVIADKLLQLAA